MIFDLPPETQLAIRLRALKNNATTAEIVCEAVGQTFAHDVNEARTILADQQPKVSRKRRSA
jgi:hypothetical protein